VNVAETTDHGTGLGISVRPGFDDTEIYLGCPRGEIIDDSALRPCHSCGEQEQ